MYDIEIMCPISNNGHYRRRFLDFKKYGLVNVGTKKVLVKLLIGTEDIAYAAKGWEENVDVEVVKSVYDWHACKISDYYSSFSEESVNRARWFAKFDDDSVTDVSALVDELDLEFDHEREYYVVTELCKEQHEPEVQVLNKIGYGRWKRPGSRLLVHEWEGNVVSQAGMRRIVNTPDSVRFLNERKKIVSGPGDLGLALAARIAKIYPAETNFMTRHALAHDFTLFGGNYSHIHFVSHDVNPNRFERIKLMTDRIRGEVPSLPEELCHRDYAFCREENNVIAILSFLPWGAIAKYHNYNEAFWDVKINELHLFTEDLAVSSAFYLDEVRGYNYIEGKYMFEPNVRHSLRAISS